MVVKTSRDRFEQAVTRLKKLSCGSVKEEEGDRGGTPTKRVSRFVLSKRNVESSLEVGGGDRRGRAVRKEKNEKAEGRENNYSSVLVLYMVKARRDGG